MVGRWLVGPNGLFLKKASLDNTHINTHSVNVHYSFHSSVVQEKHSHTSFNSVHLLLTWDISADVGCTLYGTNDITPPACWGSHTDVLYNIYTVSGGHVRGLCVLYVTCYITGKKWLKVLLVISFTLVRWMKMSSTNSLLYPSTKCRILYKSKRYLCGCLKVLVFP